MRICNLFMVLCPWFIGFCLQVMELIYLCNILKTILYPFMDRELYSLSSAFHAIVSHRNSESKLGQFLLPQHNSSQNWATKRPLWREYELWRKAWNSDLSFSKTIFFLIAAVHGIFPAHYSCLFLCLFWGYVHLHQEQLISLLNYGWLKWY